MNMRFTGERFVPQLRGQIYYEHFHRYALAYALASDKDVLDVASGEGYGAAFLATAARSVVGVDIDEASVRHAAARYPAMNLSFRAGSATQIPVADASIDFITCFETIEHLAEHEQMLREMARILRPDGRLLISSPNRLVYSDLHDYSNPYHVRELYFDEFRDLLRGSFPEVVMYGQRLFAACATYPIAANATDTRWLGPSAAPQAAMPSLGDPVYFLALCGRLPGQTLADLSTIYVDVRDDLLEDIRSGERLDIDAPAQALPQDVPTYENLALPASSAPSEEEALKAQVLEIEQLRLEQEAFAKTLAIENDRLRAQCEELEQLRSAESERADRAVVTAAESSASERGQLEAQCAELELLRNAEFARADRAEQELRVSRKREAEGRLIRETVEAELREALTRFSEIVAQLQEAQQTEAVLREELNRVHLDEWQRQADWELLLAKISTLEAILVQARVECDTTAKALDELQSSTSWRVTKPLRTAVSQIRLKR